MNHPDPSEKEYFLDGIGQLIADEIDPQIGLEIINKVRTGEDFNNIVSHTVWIKDWLDGLCKEKLKTSVDND